MEENKIRSEAYYLDDNHSIVDPDKATNVVINEYNENGVMIRETWGFTNRVPGKEAQEKHERSQWLKHLFMRKKASIAKNNTEQASPKQGIVWIAGQLEGLVLHLSEKEGQQVFCIGTEAEEGPDLLIHSDTYVYFCVRGSESNNPHEYYVICDFDGPIRPAQSGDVFRFGKEVFRLL